MLLVSKQASALQLLQVETATPGSACSVENGSFNSGVHFYGAELWNSSGNGIWAECPLPLNDPRGWESNWALGNYTEGFTELGFRGTSGQGPSNAISCVILGVYEDGARIYWNWSSTNNFGSYYELVWPYGAYFAPPMPASQSLDCYVGANTVLSMYRGVSNINVEWHD
jgi:hypothetical protein